MSVFLDTNILMYAVMCEPGEGVKRNKARDLLARNDCVLSVQVLDEFTVQALKSKPGRRMPIDTIAEYVAGFRRFRVQNLTVELYDEAISIQRRGGFSWWDSTIVAAARAQGCEILYTEDMQDGRIIDRLRIVNPFA